MPLSDKVEAMTNIAVPTTNVLFPNEPNGIGVKNVRRHLIQ